MDDFCRRHGMITEDFLLEASELKVPEKGTDWDDEPLYCLIDLLTQNHRDYLQHDIPDIKYLLDIHSIPAYPYADWLKSICRDFDLFLEGFTAQMREEENFFFPRILRYEACLNDRTVHPEFHKGSLSVYINVRSVRNGKRIRDVFSSLLEKTHNHSFNAVESPALGELQSILTGFGNKLSEHGALETDILFPRAGLIEKALYNLSIKG